MKARVERAGDAGEALRRAFEGDQPARRVRSSRRAERMIAANVTEEEYDIIAEHARRAGLKMAEYVRGVAISPQATYDTDYARIAKPLSQASYLIAQIERAAENGNAGETLERIGYAKRIIAAALLPLSRSHDGEVRSRTDGR